MLLKQIDTLKGIGEKLTEAFNSLSIYTINDLLEYFPYRYEFFEKKHIEELIDNEVVTVEGTVVYPPSITFHRHRRSRLQFTVEVDGIAIKAILFNQPYAQKQLQAGQTVTLTGKWDARRLQLTVNRYQRGTIDSGEQIEPFYSSRENLSNKRIRSFITQALNTYGKYINEVLPEYYLTEYKLPARREALYSLHRPQSREHLKHARRRFVYEELLLFQLKLQQVRLRQRVTGDEYRQQIDGEVMEKFIRTLPFTLTDAQQTALNEIISDMKSPHQMNRLLQGDVGSGKTVVATIALLATVTANKQGALMVPTEILAEQHYATIRRMLQGELHIGLLTSSVTGKKRRELLQRMKENDIHLIIGTHSLIQDEVEFANLGLAIIDEQHRFGVAQRKTLREKGLRPDVLFMTATPIPRTLAITTFGDMDVSIIDELPQGRKEIETYWVTDSMVERVLEFIHKRIKANEQVYVVSPLIEESDVLDYENAIDLYNELDAFYRGEITLGLLHGRMAQDEKEAVMKKFIQHDIQLLVATTVIEVGVDVPNASVIVIYDAERFGLSQLHQLRGRVGRGDRQSYCILIANPKGETAKERMRIMTETTDGFKLAEEDLKLRGPGDFFGKQQSGLPQFKVADLIHDYRALEVARQDAVTIITNGLLESDERYVHLNERLKEELKEERLD